MPDASMMRGQKSSHMGVTMETKVLLGTWDTEEEGELVGIQSVSPARKSWLLAILFLGMMLRGMSGAHWEIHSVGGWSS